MKQQIATTREQSARLLQCGVPAESADMHWHGAIVPRDGSLTDPPYPSEEWDLFNSPYWLMPEEMQKAKLMEDYYEVVPAFSLGSLLALLPKEIYDENDDSFYFSLAKEFPLTEEYGAAYLECWSADHAPIVRKRDNNPIEACVQLIEWLTSNGYKLNEQ